MLGSNAQDEDKRLLQGAQAEELFPDLFGGKVVKREKPKATKKVKPPAPPGDSWMDTAEQENAHDANGHFALVLVQNPDIRIQMVNTLNKMGYLTIEAGSAEDACDRLKVESYQLIICDTDSRSRSFHNYLIHILRPGLRRLIFYVLVGPGLRTGYDLEAMALSANLVIGSGEVSHLGPLLNRGFRTYEQLFGSYLDELGESNWPVLRAKG